VVVRICFQNYSQVFCSPFNIGFHTHQNIAHSSFSKISPGWLPKIEPKIKKKGWSSLTEQFSGALLHLCSEELQQAQFLGSTLTVCVAANAPRVYSPKVFS